MISGATWLLVGNVVYALAQWGTVIAIARLGSIAEQGEYSYALAVLAPLTMLSRFNLRAMLATDQDGEFEYRDYYIFRLASTFVPAILGPGYVILTQDIDSLPLIVACVGLLKVAEGLSDIAYGQLQREQSFRRISSLLMARAIILLVTFTFGFWLTGKIWISALVVAAIWTVLHFRFEYRPLRSYGSGRLTASHYRVLRSIFHKCWPLGISMALLSLINYIPLFTLQAYGDFEEVGSFAAVNYVLLIGVFIATSASQAIASFMARCYHESLANYLKMFGLIVLALIAVGLAIAVPVGIFSDWLVILIYGDQYQGLGPVLKILSIAIVINMLLSIMGLNLTIARSLRPMMFMNILSVIAITAFSLWLVPEFKAIGAAYATVYGLSMKLLFSTLLGGFILWNKHRSGISGNNISDVS